MRTPALGLRRRSSTSGVLPIAWTMSPYLPPHGLLSRRGSSTSESVVRCRAVFDGQVLLTGYPGFIGRRLADRLAEGGARVTALVEPRMAAAAREVSGGRVQIVEGDISRRRLGLSDEDWERLVAEVRHVFHLAAVYDLSVPLELAQRVNVDGTGNVLDLCLACERLERLNYVSTAYVAGTRRGVVYEHELALGQEFKNHYESTKFQAEVWVRQELDRVPTTIYRPAIVVGDSRTGETQKFDGPYFMLRVIALCERLGAPIPQFGRSNAPFNVVPVDFVLDAMLAGASEPAAVGQTFHLVDPEPVTAVELLGILSEAYAGRGPSYRLAPRLVATALRVPAVRKVLGGAAGLRVPRFEEYAQTLVRFFREHQDHPAYSQRTVSSWE